MSRQRIVSVALVVVGLVILGVWIFRPAPTPGTASAPSAKPSAPGATHNPSGGTADTDPSVPHVIARVESAVLTRPKSEAEVTDLAARLEQAVLKAAKGLPRDRAITDAQARDLARLMRTRVELLLVPDYDKYRKHVIDLTGRDPDGAPPGGVIVSSKMWEDHANRYRLAPIDPDAVEIRCLYFRGKQEPEAITGQISSSRDATEFYSSVGLIPNNPRLDVYDVSVPLEVLAYGTNKPITALFVLSVAWRPDRQRWVPWQAALNDVYDQSDILPPWL